LHDGKNLLRDDIPDQAAGVVGHVTLRHQALEGTACLRWILVTHLLINDGQDRLRQRWVR
jgi:hypothetical protein